MLRQIQSAVPGVNQSGSLMVSSIDEKQVYQTALCTRVGHMNILAVGYGSPTHICVTKDYFNGLHIIIVTRVHVIYAISTQSPRVQVYYKLYVYRL